MKFSEQELQNESTRLLELLHNLGWGEEECSIYAPLTLEIKALKEAQNAIILAHSYQTPDIMYGVADFIGDSYGLSKQASENKANKIIFCGVYFMAETAKIMNPHKEVFVTKHAGCSLAEAITAEDVRNLRKQHPEAGCVCYVNTTAEVKAEVDVCCTSANALKIVEAMPQNEIIFIPDEFMAKNIAKQTTKKIIPWTGKCIVHENFSTESIDEIRQNYAGVQILAHTECSPAVIDKVDFAGGTSGMLDFVKNSNAKQFMVVTECGITDRIKNEFPDKEVVGTCNLCPYMKEIQLKDILELLKNPTPEQSVTIKNDTAEKAKKSLEKMFELSEKKL